MQTIEPLDQLIEKIKDEFKKSEKPGQIIAEHMKDYLKQGHDDWKKYAFFCKHSYSRNLVHIDDNFEMIVLCWEEGQESPVHNHSGQDCWMAVLEGDMRETYYYQKSESKELIVGTTQDYSIGEVAYITDDHALHKVAPINGKGCTLHIYSKPIPVCNIYDVETGKIQKRKMGFFSIRGQKSPSLTNKCYLDLKEKINCGMVQCKDEYKNLFQCL